MVNVRTDFVKDVKTLLSHIKIRKIKTMVIYEKELRVYIRTNALMKVYAVLATEDPKPTWELEFQLKGENDRALFVTSLNKPRQFPNLNSLVKVLQELCPDVDDIVLGIKKPPERA